MKKLFLSFFLLTFIFLFAACRKGNAEHNRTESQEDTEQQEELVQQVSQPKYVPLFNIAEKKAQFTLYELGNGVTETDIDSFLSACGIAVRFNYADIADRVEYATNEDGTITLQYFNQDGTVGFKAKNERNLCKFYDDIGYTGNGEVHSLLIDTTGDNRRLLIMKNSATDEILSLVFINNKQFSFSAGKSHYYAEYWYPFYCKRLSYYIFQNQEDIGTKLMAVVSADKTTPCSQPDASLAGMYEYSKGCELLLTERSSMPFSYGKEDVYWFKCADGWIPACDLYLGNGVFEMLPISKEEFTQKEKYK